MDLPAPVLRWRAERELVRRLHRTGEDLPAGVLIDATVPLAEVVDEVLRRAAGGAPLSGGGIDQVLAAARAGVQRLSPQQTVDAMGRGALLVDTRTEAQRREQGGLPGALVIDRTVLEWRLDPASPDRIPEATGYDLQVVVACRQGYSSSLAAASLRAVGLTRATDLAGGVEAWLAAGLPLTDAPADVRR